VSARFSAAPRRLRALASTVQRESCDDHDARLTHYEAGFSVDAVLGGGLADVFFRICGPSADRLRIVHGLNEYPIVNMSLSET